MEVDIHYEYDAPQYYDFKQERPENSCASAWFAKDTPAATQNRAEDDSSQECTSKVRPASSPLKQKSTNIVTSWGNANGKTSTAQRRCESELRPRGTNQPQTKKISAPGRVLTVIGNKENKAHSRQEKDTRPKPAKIDEGRQPLSSAAASHNENKLKPAVHTMANKKVNIPDKVKKVVRPVMVHQAKSFKLTLPEDVELATAKRAESSRHQDKETPTSPWKSLAERVKEFDRTPDRFKVKAAKPELRKPSATKAPTNTQPKEPVLWTSTRSREPRFKPRQVLEEEEMAKMPTFQAKPVRGGNSSLGVGCGCNSNTVLSGSGQLAVPKTEKKKTEPEPFQLATDQRHALRVKPQMPQDEPKHEFKAQPLNKRILQAPAFKPQKEVPQLTIPQSPKLLTKQRVHQEKYEEPKYEFHARPVPTTLHAPPKGLAGVKSQEPTQPAPFNLKTEQRGKAHQQAFKTKLQAQEQEQRAAHQVKASMLPVSTEMPIFPPKPLVKGLTMPEPFQLQSEMRHQAYVATFQEELEELEQQRRAEAEFKAKPCRIAGPFKVHESDKELTVPATPQLSTKPRAMARTLFDMAVEEKWKAVEEQKKRAEEELARQEQEAAKEARKAASKFKAKPMPDFEHVFMALPSNQPLTNPHTPLLSFKQRSLC